jgi:tetratricopeptide (TPR) repeat protein
MKTIFRFLSTGVLTAAMLAVAATAGFGQDAAATPSPSCADIDGHNALYTKFTGIYAAKTLPEMKAALSTGKEYLEKYGTCTEAFKEQIEFVKPHVARLEKAVPEKEKGETLKPFFTKYDAGITSDNAADVLLAGKEILNVNKDDLNIIVPMALSASYQSNKDNGFKYADDGIRYANIALAKLKSGAELTKKDKSNTPVVGVLKYTFTKDQAIGELTYALAYLNYYGKKDKNTALPLFYELSQNSVYKNDPRIYGTIGDYYIEQGAPIGDEIAKLIQQIKDATDEKVKEDLDTQVKAKIAMFNGYTERALDAYSRAHSVAKGDTPATKTYKDNLYKIMQGLYKRRFEKDTGLDQYVSATLAKPFPNPTSPVTPISDPEPATTTGTAAPAGAAPASTTAAKPPTKPMSTTGNAKAATVKKGTR